MVAAVPVTLHAALRPAISLPSLAETLATSCKVPPLASVVAEGDTATDVAWLVGKILPMRVFEDEDGKMNRSILDTGGDALVVSQFTLHARTKKGTRPSFDRAARPEVAIPLYERFVAELSAGLGKPLATGEFGAMMKVALVNDGPVTILLDSRVKE